MGFYPIFNPTYYNKGMKKIRELKKFRSGTFRLQLG